MIDALAGGSHYLDHLAPVWSAIHPNERGTLWCYGSAEERALGLGLKHKVGLPPGEGLPILVASHIDLRRARYRRVIFLEHGAGQQYTQGFPSYPGGAEREPVVAFLCPNEAVARANRDAYPKAVTEIVGSPRLDRYSKAQQETAVSGLALPSPVAVSFHFDCTLVPESRWAFPWYRPVLPDLASTRELIGHSHPRAWGFLHPFWESIGVPAMSDFDHICDRAAVYVCDNSSTLYEFAAATGRPVVVLNAPWYRRDVFWGLRFWEFADVGVQVSDPAALDDAIAEAIEDPPDRRERRNEIVQTLFGSLDGGAAARAVDVIRSVM